MKELSPKKYIETKARSLPIYKCFINKDWNRAKMVNVIVMRRHVNGNVTAGLFLIDLLCLGVKDAVYLFNEPEEKVLSFFENVLIEVDYNLAHNIVFAGHDFAMDYDIQPHPEFKTARFILEEDSDDIPLIDIPVGDKNGLPSLILPAGQEFKYRHVFDKLTAKLGKNNFNYYVGSESEDDFDEEYEDDDDEFDGEDEMSDSIDDYEMGIINPYSVQFINTKDLMDSIKNETRSINESLTIELETKLRMLRLIDPELFDRVDVEERDGYDEIDDAPFLPEKFTQEMEDEIDLFFNDYNIYSSESSIEDKEEIDFVNEAHAKLLHKYSNNPFVVGKIADAALALDLPLQEEVIATLKKLSLQYPLAKIQYAFSLCFLGKQDSLIDYVLKGDDIHEVFPKVETFSLAEINEFWFLKVLYALKNNNLKNAIYFYELYAETNLISLVLIKVQELFLEKLNEVFEQFEKNLI